MNTHTLPVITGKPYTPKRNIKPYQVTVECTDGEDCKVLCHCADHPGDGGHLMRHHGAHQHSKTVTPPTNGSGWLERKASGEIIYHAPWLKKPAKANHNVPRARVETEAKAFERLRKECPTPEEEKSRPGVQRAISGHDGGGYRVVETNGHWAVMKADKDKSGTAMPYLGTNGLEVVCTFDNPELHNALKRAVIMADPRSKSVVIIGQKSVGRVYLYSSSSDAGDFVESIPADVQSDFKVCLDLDYFTHPLGSWPLRMYWKDDEGAVVFEPEGRSWRFVVMPMSEDRWDAAAKAIRELGAAS